MSVKGISKLNYSYSDDFFKLNYRGTDTPIKLGDHVIYSEWFGLKRTEGRVSYVPGISPLRSDLSDSEKSSLWGISIPGDFIQMLYVSDDKFISKKIKFVRRGDDGSCGLQPNEALL